MEDLQELIKIGKVSSVNVKNRTARIIFEDKEEMVSAELPVLVNHPLITIKKIIDGDNWSGTGEYNSVPRNFENATYKKELPDTITLLKEITYETETKIHELKVEIHPWLPYVEQMVVAVFLPIGAGDGFIIGGF